MHYTETENSSELYKNLTGKITLAADRIHLTRNILRKI